MNIMPPQSETELLARAHGLSGKTLQQLAVSIHYPLPVNYQRAKGWVGHLIEAHLGASAGSKAEPDFPHLGIELKTLPLNHRSEPKESTFVCTIDLQTIGNTIWETSLVYRKLSRVLWIPVEADPAIAIADRRIGDPILWSANQHQTKQLKDDWTEHCNKIVMGELETIKANQGVYLQVRPKAANGRSLCYGTDQDGNKVLTLPRGFYLRTVFTKQIFMKKE